MANKIPDMDRAKPVQTSTVNNTTTPKNAIVKHISIINICNAISIMKVVYL
tara:strand:- start:182 stop:334 length:153 start_codon:yes stop_codon:yes gene_type:complete